MFLCLKPQLPSFEHHHQDAEEGNGGRRGVPLRLHLHRSELTSVDTTAPAHSHVTAPMLFCLLLQLPSSQLHLQDAGECNGGRREVPLHQQQVHSQAQPHKLCVVEVRVLQNALSPAPSPAPAPAHASAPPPKTLMLQNYHKGHRRGGAHTGQGQRHRR